MKIQWKTMAAFVAGLAGLVGVSGCDVLENLGDIINPVAMYGCPYADYSIDITVTDEDGTPIKGIEVRGDFNGNQPLYTSEQGKVEFKETVYGGLYAELTDVDGEENGGEFENATIEYNGFELTQTKKGEDWYSGEYEAKATVKMKRKAK